MKRSRFTKEQIIVALREQEAGMKVSDPLAEPVARPIQVHEC